MTAARDLPLLTHRERIRRHEGRVEAIGRAASVAGYDGAAPPGRADRGDGVLPTIVRDSFAFFVTHDLPEHFPDPYRFDIGRYLPEREEHKKPGVFTPFGAGVHHCSGRGLAEVQMPLLVATLLHEVEMELVPSTYGLKSERWILFPSFLPDKRFRFAIRKRRH